MKKIVLLDIDSPKKNSYQFFLDWFKEAWIANGGEVKQKIELPRFFRSVISRTRITRSTFFRSKRIALLAIGGADIDFTAFPHSFFYEVVPVYWDTWPQYNSRLYSAIKRSKIKTAFFTQRQVASSINTKFPMVRTFWIPEGIKTDIYNPGKELISREIDILQYGRRLESYHGVIKEVINDQNYLYSKNLNHKIFSNQEDLVSALSNSKICVCFPRMDTHPKMAGGIETLTQRYWEALLSRCLVVGRAPKELVDLLGYNPVLEVNWEEPEKQLETILSKVDTYQEFVNRNYENALKHGSWNDRVKSLILKLNSLGYEL